MVECEECGKTLGIFEGYRHPTLGKSHHLCSPCFDQVNESVARWREFILPYVDFFNNESSNNSLQLNWKNILTSSIQIRKMFELKKEKKGFRKKMEIS